MLYQLSYWGIYNNIPVIWKIPKNNFQYSRDKYIDICLYQQISIWTSSSGSDLVFQAVTRQVSSAQWSLTSVFGMGTGVTSTLLPPDIYRAAIPPRPHFLSPFSLPALLSDTVPCTLKTIQCKTSTSTQLTPCTHVLGQALGLLVLLSYIHHCTSTCNLSNT